MSLTPEQIERVREYHERAEIGAVCRCGEDPCLKAQLLETIATLTAERADLVIKVAQQATEIRERDRERDALLEPEMTDTDTAIKWESRHYHEGGWYSRPGSGAGCQDIWHIALLEATQSLVAADALAKVVEGMSTHGHAVPGGCYFCNVVEPALAEYRKARGTAPNYGEPGKPMPPHMGDKA